MDTKKTDNEPQKENQEQNPLEQLKKQLEGILGGGKNVKFEFAPNFATPEPEPVSEPSSADETLERIKNFSMKPREIRDYLNRFVVKQDEAKKVLKIMIENNMQNEIAKSN